MDYEKLEPDVIKLLTKHYTPGRKGKKVGFVGVHYMASNGTTETCYNTWQTREASAHYAVESSGRVGQLVYDRDTGWALGDFDANCRSINIEHANLADGAVTEACLDSGAHLAAAICKEYGLGRPQWGVNMQPHKHFMATSCPGQLYGSQRGEFEARAQYWYDVMTGATAGPEAPETPLPEVLARFGDLDPEAWYIGAVEECVREGYLKGYGADRFGPDDALTRAQAVAMVANAARADLYDYLEPYEDVAPNPWYYEALCWATDEGVVTKADKFRPDDAATRAEVVAMLHNWKGRPVPVGCPSGYPDWHEVPGWAQASMAWAVEQGVVGGAGKLMPNKACTRAEAAAMVAALMP